MRRPLLVRRAWLICAGSSAVPPVGAGPPLRIQKRWEKTTAVAVKIKLKRLGKITGDWQKFTGEPGTEGTLRTAEPRADKKERFAAAAKESQASKEAKGAKESPAKESSAKESPAKESRART